MVKEQFKNKVGESILSISGLVGIRQPKQSVEITDAKEKIEEIYRQLLMKEGRTYESIPGIDEVADWCTNSQGKGLRLVGGTGSGKTFMARYVLPVLFNCEYDKVYQSYKARDLEKRYDEIIKHRLIILDDIGTDTDVNVYGTKRDFFSYAVDDIYDSGKTLIITTNLSMKDIANKYGERTASRLEELTKQIHFKGRDLRR